jgi:hypothetical protein
MPSPVEEAGLPCYSTKGCEHCSGFLNKVDLGEPVSPESSQRSFAARIVTREQDGDKESETLFQVEEKT